MSKKPETWDEALISADLVDPRNGKPSLNQLAIRADLPASTVTAIAAGRRKPKAPTIQKIADALGIDVLVVSEWVGQERTERAPYAPPAEADLLTDRQRRAVDEIIRAIVAERASSRDEPRVEKSVSAQRDDVEDPAFEDGATSHPDTGGHRSWNEARRAAFATANRGGTDAEASAVDRNRDGSEADAKAHLLQSGSTNAGLTREDFDRAAMAGHSELEKDDAAAEQRGEDSQDLEDWT